jgi:hypothetical protein
MTTTARSNGLGLLAWATVVLAMLLMVVLSQTVERTPDERNYQMAGRALLERQGLHTIEQRFQGPLILLGTQLTDDRTQSVHDAACLRRARLGMLVFPLLLLVVLVRWTQQALGSPAACITALLAAVNPALLGYGPLLSSDVAFTATALLAAWSYWRWRNHAGLVRLLMLGAALGATMATKYTGALACAGLGVLVLSAPFGGFDAWPSKAAARRGLPARLGGALAALLVAGGFALLTLYAAYLFASPPFAAAATTLHDRLLAVMRAKLAVIEPYHRFSALMFRSAADPASPLNPFHPAGADIAAEGAALFADAIAGSSTKVPKDLAAELPGLLWTYSLGIVLYWIHDRSPGRQGTAKLIERTVEMVTTAVKLASNPLLRPFRKQIVRLMQELRPGSAGEA